MKLAPFLALLAVLGMPTVGAAHDVDVTSVARVFLEEGGEGRESSDEAEVPQSLALGYF